MSSDNPPLLRLRRIKGRLRRINSMLSRGGFETRPYLKIPLPSREGEKLVVLMDFFRSLLYNLKL